MFSIDVVKIEVEDILEYEIESAIVKIGKYKETSFVLNYNYVYSKANMEMNFEVNEIEFNLSR